jgi:hypothetical protein
MADPTSDSAADPSETISPGVAPDEDELSEAALDVVVGGLTVEAALSRAAGFDPRLLPRAPG